ncbi:MAG: YceI family protein [Robiginitomaculum sp.]|nr:YceI family protein [Robiginitomaculum sp.]
MQKNQFSWRTALIIPAIIMGMLSCAPSPAPTPHSWTIDSAASQITLFAIKADAIGETFTLDVTEGSISSTGAAQVIIGLQSIETGIPIRNGRMREHLFKIADWPLAKVSGQIDLGHAQNLTIGQRLDITTEMTVDLHGISNIYDVKFVLTRLSASRVLVQSAQPISVTADDFELNEGLAKLQQLVDLPSITPVVAVSFTLVFQGV